MADSGVYVSVCTHILARQTLNTLLDTSWLKLHCKRTKDTWMVSNDIFSVIIVYHKISRTPTVYRAMCQVLGTPKALVT